MECPPGVDTGFGDRTVGIPALTLLVTTICFLKLPDMAKIRYKLQTAGFAIQDSGVDTFAIACRLATASTAHASQHKGAKNGAVALAKLLQILRLPCFTTRAALVSVLSGCTQH